MLPDEMPNLPRLPFLDKLNKAESDFKIGLGGTIRLAGGFHPHIVAEIACRLSIIGNIEQRRGAVVKQGFTKTQVRSCITFLRSRLLKRLQICFAFLLILRNKVPNHFIHSHIKSVVYAKGGVTLIMGFLYPVFVQSLSPLSVGPGIHKSCRQILQILLFPHPNNVLVVGIGLSVLFIHVAASFHMP